MKRPKTLGTRINPWRRYCDWLWSTLIKLRAGHACEICDCTDKQLHAHHMIDREVLVYRYELMNGICLCYSCHVGDKHRAAHRNQYRFDALFWDVIHVGFDTSELLLCRWEWWDSHRQTGPEQDNLKPCLKDYPEIANFLEQERSEAF